MSMTIINNGPSINETQLHSMLTGDLKGASKLDGWEAFKNFFIKLLNHLPGISLEDKETALRDIYNKIYDTENAALLNENTKSIEPIWNALDKLIHMMQKDKVQTMIFDIQNPNDVHSIPDSQQSNEIRVKITIDGHSLADISCSSTPLNNDMLNNIITNYMAVKTGDGVTPQIVYINLIPIFLTSKKTPSLLLPQPKLPIIMTLTLPKKLINAVHF